MVAGDANERAAKMPAEKGARLGSRGTREAEKKNGGAAERYQKKWQCGRPNQRQSQNDAGSRANRAPKQPGSRVTVYFFRYLIIPE